MRYLSVLAGDDFEQFWEMFQEYKKRSIKSSYVARGKKRIESEPLEDVDSLSEEEEPVYEPYGQTDFGEMCAEIREYLHQSPRKKYLLPMFNALVKSKLGITQQMFAERLGITQGRVSQLLRELKDTLIRYAKNSGNDLLLSLLSTLKLQTRKVTK